MLGNIEPDLQIHVLNQLDSNAFIIADTIELWIETKREAFISLIKRVDCLVIDDSEAKLLTEEINAIEAGRKLLDLGTKMAIMTRGEHGAYLFHPDGIFAMPAYPVTELQDPTGAGDSYAGAFLGYLAAADRTDFDTLKQAMLYATVTASLTVESFSCDSLESAGSAKIKERYHELVRMISL
jgi:sugar/nucleoside kinase (ribokinase family)